MSLSITGYPIASLVLKKMIGGTTYLLPKNAINSQHMTSKLP
jgi:hypothetical protein